VQIQKLIGELAAAELSARSALTTALDDVANPDTARAAYLVARSAADHLTSRFFDALGSSASKISAQLNFYWLAARNVTLGRPAPEVAADLGARLLGVAR
jgi:hypothetical protein